MPISRKQKQIMAFPYTSYDALICDGAIRSGKTVFMMLSFVDDAMRRYNNQRFGICGKTVDSTVKNLIIPYLSLSYAKGKYNIQWRRTDKIMVVSNGERENIFEIFGGKDESSFALIQGRTLAGVLFDEVALQPKSFVDQACARCSVDGSKMWFNCNPASPQHWFYTEWICQLKKHNAIRIHFLLEDNPSLSEHIINRYKSTYSGVFYRRYILGEWCLAEGLIYSMFDGTRNICSPRNDAERYFLSCDYGTQNPFALGLISARSTEQGTVYHLERELYYDGRKSGQLTDSEYADRLTEFCSDVDIQSVIVDPSAASFIAELRKRGYRVIKARNDVIDGIRYVSSALIDGRLLISPDCENTLREFGVYSWDEKAGERGEDKPIKQNDHAMDMLRYALYTDKINIATGRNRYSGKGGRT